MERRQIIAALGSLLLLPCAAIAQQQVKAWRIGVLWERSAADPRYEERMAAFKKGMLELGHVDGKHYSIEPRFAGNDTSRFPVLAADLVASKVDVIVAVTTPGAQAAAAATNVIPILFTTVGDPIESKLVKSLSHPAGNVTGLTNQSADLTVKLLDLLREVVPRMKVVAYLYNPSNAANLANLRRLEAKCSELKIACIRAPVFSETDVATAFSTIRAAKVQGLIISGANNISSWQKPILENIAALKLPAISATGNFTDADGMISYATNWLAQHYRLALYVDKIIKGVKPGDLPVEQPTKFDLVVNQKAAKALGIKIPDSILLRADKVIE